MSNPDSRVLEEVSNGIPNLQIENISYQYEGQSSYALENVTLDIYEGEWLAIVGHNGSGKSTIAKLLNGLQFPQKGKSRSVELT